MSNSTCCFCCCLFKGKKPGLVCLIPELCYITGLTDAVRQDFRVMKVSVFCFSAEHALLRIAFRKIRFRMFKGDMIPGNGNRTEYLNNKEKERLLSMEM